jgi:hypothetical protein
MWGKLMKNLCAPLVLAVSFISSDAYAYEKYSTEFLAPKDVWAVNLNFSRGSVSSRYDSKGGQKSLSAPLNGVTPLGLASGSLKFETKFVEITAGYGLADDLSLGFRFPVGESCSKASLDLAGAPVTVETLLMDPQFGFAYTDIDSHCDSGLMGPVLGAAWRIYKGEYDSLVFLPGVRLGRLTDKTDADVLFQPIVDDGSNDIILRTDYYRDLQNALDLTVQFEYNIQLKDKKTRRIPSSALPLASIKERVERDLGDYVILDVELGYRFWNDQLRIFTAYYQKSKDGDSYSSSQSTNTQFLEQGTTFRDQEVRTGIYFDGVPAWRAGKLPFPLRLELNYWESFGGKNSLKYHFTELHATFAF